MHPAELRDRARTEIEELGLEPIEQSARTLWREERRGALVLLAALADYDPALLLRATLEDADTRLDAETRALLLDTAQLECGGRSSSAWRNVRRNEMRLAVQQTASRRLKIMVKASGQGARLMGPGQGISAALRKPIACLDRVEQA
jgi:hypothetical protein